MSATLILGDPHLGRSLSLGKSGVGSALNSRIVDQCNILEWTLDRAIEFNVSNMILTGDVFDDPKPHHAIITLFISWLKKCTDNDVNVHIIAGNHDILRSGQFYTSALDIISAADISGVSVYKYISTLHTPGASFTLLPFRDRRSFNVESNSEAINLLQNKIPYELAGIELSHAKVVVGHLAIEGSLPVGDEIDDMTNELFCPVSMFKGYDFVWMGHIHKPQIMAKSPFIAHIGSMDLSDFSESDHKKVIVIFDPKNSEPFKYLEIPTRPLNQILVSVPAHITDTTNFVIQDLKDRYKNLSRSIIRLNISLDNANVSNIDRSAIEKCLNDLGSFHISRINEDRKISPIKQNSETKSIDSTVNEPTAIKMYADVNIEDSIKNEFVALANEIVKECIQ